MRKRHLNLAALSLGLLLFLSLGCKKSIIEQLVAENAPTVTLNAATFTAGNSAINSSGTATLAVTFTGARSTTLVASTGTSTTPPNGISVNAAGGVSCTSVAVVNPSSIGATLQISGCSGDGTVTVSVNAGVAAAEDGEEVSPASVQRVINVRNTLPVATLAVTSAVVGTTDGANTAVATFASLVKNLSATNANSEFTLSGCSISPTVSIAMSVVASHSVATATLSGGTCPDGSTVSVSFHLDKVTDVAGNVGVAGSNPAAQTFGIDTTVPSAALAAPIFATGPGAINSSDTATLALTYTNAAAITLTGVSGTTSSPPAGLSVSTSGGVSCANVAIVTPTTAGADIEVSGCTGDGTVLVQVNAGTATSAGGLPNVATAQRTVIVQNTPPTATLAVATPIVGTTNGANVVTATFASRVQNLSSSNAGSEFVVTGCSSPPAVAIAMSVNGSGNSVATATLSGGTCANGATVTIGLQRNNVTDLAGNAGTAGSNPSASFAIDTSAAIATLAAASYPGSQGAMKSGDTTTLALTYTNTSAQTLTAVSGTTAAAPTGLTVSTTNTASCSNVAIGSPSTSGATISVSGCTGDGAVLVTVNAAVATGPGGVANAASAQRTIWVENSPPTVTLSGTAAIGLADGGNSITADFNSLVADLSPTNGGGELTITGCPSQQPAVVTTMSDDGNGHSRAVFDLSNGICGSGVTISVQLEMNNVTDRAGNAGVVNPPAETYLTP